MPLEGNLFSGEEIEELANPLMHCNTYAGWVAEIEAAGGSLSVESYYQSYTYYVYSSYSAEESTYTLEDLELDAYDSYGASDKCFIIPTLMECFEDASLTSCDSPCDLVLSGPSCSISW